MNRLRSFVALLVLFAFTAIAQQPPATSDPKKKGDQDTKTTASDPKVENKKTPDKKPAAKESAEKKDTKDTGKKEEKKEEAKKEEEKPKDPLGSEVFSGLRFRSIGPAVISGRISSIAVNPKNRASYFVAAASGGVWKTDNNGITWTAVFEREGSYSIGTVVIDPKDTNIVWVGTGENNSQRSVGYGDGVYRSEDGGRSWKNMGLKKSEHIARIVIDPRDSNVVYVASQGPLWGPGGDRGVFKTTDGGKTWKNVLTVSENTGASDLVIDPSNPDVLYATSYQRRRHVYTMINGGPESNIYKSVDAGATWSKLTNGIPGGDKGRIGLAISPSDPNVIYAQVEAANRAGGIFRSTNRGATWEKRNDYDVTAMYYATMYVDPKNPDRLYVMNVFIQVSDDGGRTLRRLGERYKHVDNHAMYIDPNDPKYFLVGCDGGLYESYDGGANWLHKTNLSIAQFYDIAIDNSKPFYYVYGGTQDNNSLGGPTRSRNVSGVTNADWFVTQGGDGFRQAVDPEDPNIVYSEYQHGGLTRFDRRTGGRIGIQPQPGKGEEPLRWNWDSPLIISPHSHTRLYFAANKLFRSDDRGDSWKLISGDLTRQLDRDKLPVMGKIWGPDAVAKHASTSFYGNIVALSESPRKENLIYVGTDDGLIQVTEDAGGTWKKYEAFAPVPANTYVSRLVASNHDDRTVYATFSNHKNADFKPYVLKSTDAGATWKSISANLPENGPVWAFAEDTVNPNLLFVGTEFGLFMSINGGEKWTQVKGNIPTIAVRDILIHKRENDLVIGTFGRGIYILDDMTPLRQVSAALPQKEAALFTMRDALVYAQSSPLGGRGKGSQGEQLFVAENPPYGATFTYYLKDKYKTLREQRQDAEKAAAKKNNGEAYPAMPYPTKDQLRAEAEAEAPSVWLVISDANGNVVRQVAAQNNAGINRTTWNLRYPPAELSDAPAGGDDNPFSDGPGGTPVMPGKYSAKLFKKIEGKWTELAGPVSFNVTAEGVEAMSAEDRASLRAFQLKVQRLDRAVSGAIRLGNEISTRLTNVRRALRETAGDTIALVSRGDQLNDELRKLMIQLRGDNILAARNENTPPSINDRVNQIVGEQYLATAKPTKTHEEGYAIASAEFTEALAKLKTLADQVHSLEVDAEKAGAPWTSGRVPEWKPEQ